MNRSLLVANNPKHALRIVGAFKAHPRVQIAWLKDRINAPTDGGWCDLLFNFTIEGSNGHVCEVQVAFKSMIAARKEGEGHAAYALARDAIETIEAAGSAFVKEANADAGELLEQVRRLTAQVHPDKGGTTAAMQEANAARDLLLDELPDQHGGLMP